MAKCGRRAGRTFGEEETAAAAGLFNAVDVEQKAKAEDLQHKNRKVAQV